MRGILVVLTLSAFSFGQAADTAKPSTVIPAIERERSIASKTVVECPRLTASRP